MSLLAVQGGATGTGTVTLLAPVTNTNRTLTLPDVTGTVAVQGGTGVGKVLQVVQASSSTGVINNTASYVDTGLSATITPSSTGSRVLVYAVVPFQLGSNNGTMQLQFNIVRNATELTSNLAVNNVSAIVQLAGIQVLAWFDSPSTTSATTYKIQFKELSASNRYGNTAVIPTWNAAQTGVIQLMEVAA